MSRRSTVRRALCTTLLAAVALGACGDDGDGSATSTSAPPTTTTTEPAPAEEPTSTTAATSPADEDDEDGRAFVVPTTIRPLEATPTTTSTAGVRLTDLAVGDCADIAGLGLDASAPITHAEPRECDEPHGIEIYLVSSLVTEEDTAYPGDEAIVALADQTCLDGFAPYVGVAYVDAALEVVHLRPDEAAWAAGDRVVHCAVHSRDLRPLTESVRRDEG